MADRATQITVIDAPADLCFEVATDFARYPEWATDVKQVEIVERDDDGRGSAVRYRAAAMGRSTVYTLRYFYGSNPLRFAWKLLEGDLTRQLDGDYTFAPVGGGPDRTEVTYNLVVDLVVPVPGFVKRRAEAKIVRTALEDLRRRVEASFAR